MKRGKKSVTKTAKKHAKRRAIKRAPECPVCKARELEAARALGEPKPEPAPKVFVP